MAAPLLTVPEVSQRLRLSRFTLYHLVRDGRLPAVRLARKLLFREEDVDKAIRRAVATGAAP